MRTLAAEKKLCHPDGQPGDRRERLPRRRRADPFGHPRTDQGDPTSGPIARSGRRASAGPRTRPASPTTSAGTSSSARPTTGRITPTTSRSTGAAGSTSAPARSATWPATRSTSPHGAGAVRPRVGRGRRYLGDRRPRELSGLVDHPHPVRPAERPRPAHPDLVRRRREAARGQADLQGTPPRREGRRAAACCWSARRARSSPRTTTAPSTCCCPRTSSRRSRSPSRPCRARQDHFNEWVEAIKAGDPDKADVEFRLRRPAHRDRAAGRRRPQGRHSHRVGRRGHEGQERARRPTNSSAAIIARDSRSTEAARFRPSCPGGWDRPPSTPRPPFREGGQ